MLLLTPGKDRTISGNATLETVTFTVPRTNARDPVAKARYGRPEGAESRAAFSSDDNTANTLGTRSVDSD